MTRKATKPQTPPELPPHTLVPLLSEDQIQSRIREIGQAISNELGDKEAIVITVLKGAFIFVADLVRQLEIPVKTEFMRVSSYGNRIVTSGEVKLELDLQDSIANKHVILVEDIVDTGLTVEYLKTNLLSRQPASLKTCTLLHKPSNNVKISNIDYVGFNIPAEFVVGYGLDYQGFYRNLPYVAQIEFPS